MTASRSAWVVFAASMAVLLSCDLFLHRGRRQSSRRSDIAWFVVWLSAGLGFDLFIWAELGTQAAHEYLAAYAIEKGLSLDNLLVFWMIFRSLEIPAKNQHVVLMWGVLGALVLRGAFVFLGASALDRWHWVSVVFGLLLAAAAVRAFRERPDRERRSHLLHWLSKHLPVTRDATASSFTAIEHGTRSATPLLLALVALELTDVVFAIDSVPAALSVSHSRFIVYSSNAFAILGLRTLYLILARAIRRLRYLNYGLGLVLGFAAAKLLLSEWVEIGPLTSAIAVVALIGASIAVSLVSSGGEEASATS